MKKIVNFILVVVQVFLITACGKSASIENPISAENSVEGADYVLDLGADSTLSFSIDDLPLILGDFEQEESGDEVELTFSLTY